MSFTFEKLDVWKDSLKLCSELHMITTRMLYRDRLTIGEQLRRAAMSIPLNIAEGAGRHHQKDFQRFLSIARGSLYEVVTGLHICKEMNLIEKTQFDSLYASTNKIGQMLNGLHRSLMSS